MATPLAELLGNSERAMEAEMDDYVRLGVRWLRTDFWWDWIQPTPWGAEAWSPFDRLVDAARRRGMRVLAELHGLPGWVREAGGMAAPANAEAYARYAAAAARRFRGRVRHWEIWNEPNLEDSWGGPPDPAAFARALVAAAAAIRGVDPQAFIVSGGLSPVPQTASGHMAAVPYLRGVYAAGAGGSFDALGFHPYTWPREPDDPWPWTGWRMMQGGIREAMEARGDGAKRVWITEFGAPSAGGARPVGPARQARILERGVVLARDLPWAGPVFWYSYQDRGGAAEDTENWFGLVDPMGVRKPAYEVFRRLAAGDP